MQTIDVPLTYKHSVKVSSIGEFYKFILRVFEVCFEQIAVRKEGA